MKMQVLFLQVRKLFFCNVFDYSLPPVRFFPPGLLLFHVRFPASVLHITDPFTHCHFFAFLLCWETICLFNFLNHLFNIHHGLVYSSISLLYFNIQRFFFFFCSQKLLEGWVVLATSFCITLGVFILVHYFVSIILQLISIIKSSLVCATFLVFPWSPILTATGFICTLSLFIYISICELFWHLSWSGYQYLLTIHVWWVRLAGDQRESRLFFPSVTNRIAH